MAMRTRLMLLSLALFACTGGWESEPQPTPEPGAGPSDLIGIGITPNSPKVTAGEDIQFVATGFYADRRSVDLTDVVTWQSTDESVVTISGGLDAEGTGTAEGAGQAHITASLDELQSNAARVTVTAAFVTELSIAPGDLALREGGETTVSAEAVFSDGSHGDVTGTVRWVTGNPDVVIVDPGGRITGNAIGVGSVRAIYEQGAEPIEATPATVRVVDAGEYVGNADLRILGVSTASSGSDLHYTVEVKNSGDAPSTGFWVSAWLNRTAAPSPPAEGDGSQFVASLAPDETAEVLVVVPGATAGNYTSWLLVDALDAVDEGGWARTTMPGGPRRWP